MDVELRPSGSVNTQNTENMRVRVRVRVRACVRWRAYACVCQILHWSSQAGPHLTRVEPQP